MIMATTHTDLHGEKLSREALESGARQIKDRYLPINLNHDIRYPLAGRIVSAEVIKLQDGEYGLQAIGEIFEESDSLESLTGDGREIAIEDKDIPTIAVKYDRTFRNREGQELINELSQISGEKETPKEAVKKALEPISTLVLLAGIFVVGSIAKGFFTKLGSDAYDKLKNALIRYYRKRTYSEQVLDFCFLVRENSKNCEIHVLVVDPTEEKINEVFSSKFENVDNQLISLSTGQLDIAQFVFEYQNQTLLLLYAVRRDCVPLFIKI